MKTAQEQNGQATIEDARKLIGEERRARITACESEIQTALRRHGCRLDVSVVLSARGVEPVCRVLVNE